MALRKREASPIGAGTASPTGAPHIFRTADVSRIVGIPKQRIYGMVRSRLCQPHRRGRRLEFSFQDLVLLRTARALLETRVSGRRLRRTLRDLSGQLPPGRPLSGVRIYADGRNLVVRDGKAAWEPDTGQMLLVFDADDLARRAVSARGREAKATVADAERKRTASQYFESGLALEGADPLGAQAAYERAVELDPDLGDAYVNLGRLAHESGKTREAVQLYREALKISPKDAVAHFNLGVALEDAGDNQAAASHYHETVHLAPTFADAHFNLSRLLEQLGKHQQALRHLTEYRKLTESG